MTNKRKGELMMVVCAVLWSVSGLIMKYVSWNFFLISGGRGLFSSIIIYVSMKYSGYKLKVTKKSWGITVCTFVNIICFVAANKLTTAANSIVLQNTAPIFVMIITAAVFKRKLKKHEIGAVGVALVGMILFFMDQIGSKGTLGNLLAITSGLFMGAMYAFTGEIEDDGERITGLCLGHFSLAVIGIPLGVVLTDPAEITLVPILLVVLLGTVQMGIPYVLYGRASAMISGIEVSLIGMIEPMLNPTWVALFYHEIPGFKAFIGAVFIIGAVIAYTVLDNRVSNESEERSS